jgi:hypothetical protein
VVEICHHNCCVRIHCHVWLQINYFRWDDKSADPHGFHRFASLMTNFRRLLLHNHVVGLTHWELIDVGPDAWPVCSTLHFPAQLRSKMDQSDAWAYICRRTESLGLGDFPTGERLEWHGIFPGTPDWTESSKFVAFTLVFLPYFLTKPQSSFYRDRVCCNAFCFVPPVHQRNAWETIKPLCVNCYFSDCL